MKNGNFKKLISSLAIVATAALTACGGGGRGGGGGGSTASPAGTTGSTASTPTVVVTPPVISITPAYTLANPPGASYALGTAQRVMFDSLNQIRIGGGFGALEQDSRLDQAAKAHADYVVANYFTNGVKNQSASVIQSDGFITVHTESQGTPGFTGIKLANRIAVTGYQATITSEVIAYSVGMKPGAEPDTKNCLSQLVNTVFHRASLMDTSMLEIGFGISGNTIDKNGYLLRACVVDLSSKQTAPILTRGWSGIYPFDQQVDVPLIFIGENPDPIPSSPVKGSSISIQSASGQTLLVTSFVLSDSNGLAVNSKVLTRTDSTFLRTNEAYLVPIGSLAANSSYFVTFVERVTEHLSIKAGHSEQL